MLAIWTLNRLIRVHIVWFHEKIESEVHLNLCSRHKKQTTFSGPKKNSGRIKQYPANALVPENVSFFFYVCCIYSNALQTTVYHESKHYEP